ncbi:L,D-transpeptidase family protein [Ruegeria sp. 2205SS24-7]|uniref:L,D-transpeptidase family protein n=1 Tax=Ruegeria discodermiae TaxID=3064389 RepID=UPI0027406177|nr:L,D-transpeptidase family protein [Ruegeria sp. 2205SS24-7]MDP5218168.1 L,D-transpeptidase family protein [Ruegeria sp. 2205SS24-7]
MLRRALLRGGLLILAIGALFVLWDRYGPPAPAPDMAAAVEQVDHILIEKSARRLSATSDGNVVFEAEIALGFEPGGDKQMEGDGKTPEGHFTIDRRNPQSAFHLSLGLDYPRPEDIARAKAQGVDPGGDIFIHGQPNGLSILTLPGDWTAGCIAVSNAEMETLWRLVPIGTPVEIRP